MSQDASCGTEARRAETGRRAFGRIAIAAILTTAAIIAGDAQTQQSQPFRGGTTLINVDVYPRRNGQVIEGLTPADFEIFEDGVQQKIDGFEFIRTQPMTPEAERRDPGTKAESDALAADPHNRLFVIYLDIFHTTFEGSHATKPTLLQFLTRAIGPTDLFGVMTPEVSPAQLVFGRRIDTFSAELDRHMDRALRDRVISPVGRSPLEAQLETCMSGRATLLGDALVALHREDETMTHLEELMVRLSALRDGRKSVLFVSEGWLPQPPSRVLTSLVSGAISQPGQGRGGTLVFDPRVSGMGQSASWCDSQILRLGNIDFERRFRDLLTSANRANVSFYTVDAGGLRAQAPDRAPTMPPIRPNRAIAAATSDQGAADAMLGSLLDSLERPSVRTLQELAENTDGMAIVNTNDLGAGMRRIADDLSAYYLLGYSSTNTKLDGKFRRIEVKVKQPNVSIAARRGYLAASEESRAAAVAAAATAAANAVPVAVAGELGRLSRLRPDAELFSYGVVRNGGLQIAIELSWPQMSGGRWSSGAELNVVASGASGAEATAVARLEAGARGGRIDVLLPPGATGPWRVNLRVSNGAAVLNDQLEIADAPTAANAVLGAPMLFRGTSSARVPLRPVADFQFRRTERLRAEWPVTAPLDERLARVLDRRGSPMPLQAAATEADTPQGRVVDVDLALAPLAEGDYLIELVAGRGGRTTRGLVAFRVVRN